MSLKYLVVLALALGMAAPAAAQESYKLEKLNDAPPAGLAAGIKESLESRGYRVVDSRGKPLVDLWLRKGAPATAKPSGASAAVLFPVLTEGELIGAARFSAEGHDYRDQTINPGLYTLRYGLQPVNGDHLGVSVNRDYALLLPAAKDTEIADLPRKKLEQRSAEAVGTTHPAVLILLSPPERLPDGPSMVHDPMLETWGAIVSLPLAVKGEANPVALPMQLVVVGAKKD